MQFTARSTVERRKTLEDVKRAEREAIETEHPIFNKQYNNTPEAKARMRMYLIEAAARTCCQRIRPQNCRRRHRGEPNVEQVLALLLDTSLAPNALRIGCLMALGWSAGEIVAELEMPRSTYYGALRQLTASAKSRTEPQVALMVVAYRAPCPDSRWLWPSVQRCWPSGRRCSPWREGDDAGPAHPANPLLAGMVTARSGCDNEHAP